MHNKRKEKRLIGRKDYADFPELDLSNIKIKIDTGAYTSSINCHWTQEEITGQGSVLRCRFLDPEHPLYTGTEFCFSHFKKKSVKSSNGISEDRFLVRTRVVLFDKLYPIELSLTNRSRMKYDVLIGRKFLNKNFIVDTTLVNKSFKMKNKKTDNKHNKSVG